MDTHIQTVESGQELSMDQIAQAADYLLDEQADVAKKISFLKGLASKGETPAEIAGFVECFLERAVDPGTAEMRFSGPTIDVCGTGGDKLNLFNVSTTSMFVIAAGGATVVKHGNRGITSKSGGADVLEALGVRLDISPETFRKCLDVAGVGFLFAQMYHPAFKAVAPVRAELAKEGIRTIFNLIGPLLNPVRPECQLIGVCDHALGPVFSEILNKLGRKSSWIVSGQTADGRPVDEMSLMGETAIYQSVEGGSMHELQVSPDQLGLDVCDEEALRGGDAEENAKILVAILSGEELGPKRDMVLLNAGAGLACAGIAEDIAAGVSQARELIDSGRALERLQLLQSVAK
ncbi:anthranilate phosphoribosyltransferase [Rubritalea tangerina]|uniref:Anthranilate phosphoribosyltransferase n=1 Tax=Rubritalea tangerina TaxID=430798 RepID=A0ABW4ZFC8_9BACT